jgi:D-glycero-D-manno-heptose 1,7-bisphosphate phosphatase
MRLIILDRDGVINQDSEEYIKSPEEWIAIPGSLQAIAQLNAGGWRVVVVSNQSGIGRGLFDILTLNAIHEKMQKELARVGGQVEAIFFCPHTPEDHCSCRKPRAGLLRDIAERFNVELDEVPCVGDSLRDLEAAQSVGARPILVLTGKGHEALARLPAPGDVPVFPDLAAVANQLLAPP